MMDSWSMEALGASVEPVAPPTGLRARLLAKIAAGPVAEVRADEGEWLPLGPPGVDRKLLYRDAHTGQRTYLLRLAPGSILPPHRHHTAEQCLILQGDMISEGCTYGAGDFIVVSAEREHSEVSSAHGATVLIVGG